MIYAAVCWGRSWSRDNTGSKVDKGGGGGGGGIDLYTTWIQRKMIPGIVRNTWSGIHFQCICMDRTQWFSIDSLRNMWVKTVVIHHDFLVWSLTMFLKLSIANSVHLDCITAQLATSWSCLDFENGNLYQIRTFPCSFGLTDHSATNCSLFIVCLHNFQSQ